VTAGPAAYGFRVLGIDDRDALAVRDAADWPALSVEQEIDPAAEIPPDHLSDHDGSIGTPAGQLCLDRAASRVVVRSRQGVAASDLVHPCLWPAAAVFARWRGAETLHAGGFVDAAGGAWAVLGDREAGKSSLLAALALAGHQVVVDDLLVVDGADCYAGPRCIDLRPEAVAGLAVERTTTPVRSTQRRRLALDPSDGRFALRGFAYLDWGDQVRVESVSPAEHFGLLTRHRRVSHLGADVDHLFDLAALPALRLRRPLAWEALPQACGELMAAARSGSA
jgi:hypothetical protein